jgi:hypothetical protein
MKQQLNIDMFAATRITLKSLKEYRRLLRKQSVQTNNREIEALNIIIQAYEGK